MNRTQAAKIASLRAAELARQHRHTQAAIMLRDAGWSVVEPYEDYAQATDVRDQYQTAHREASEAAARYFLLCQARNDAAWATTMDDDTDDSESTVQTGAEDTDKASTGETGQ